MAQLLKNQKSSQSVVGAGSNNQDKSSRTRTKSNATTSSMLGLNKEAK